MRCLLVIDPVGRVVLGDVDTGARIVVGNDTDIPVRTVTGAAPAGAQGRARTAVWSAAGQWTAWSVDAGNNEGDDEEPDGDVLQEVRIHHEASNLTEVVASSVTAFYLCPSPCGRFLSHLSPGPLGLELALSDVRTGDLRIVERGQPMFWSWSPDSSQIAVHVEDRVLIAPVDGGDVRQLTDRASSFVVPWWMPDGSVVIVADGELVSHGTDGTVTPIAGAAGVRRFALDSDGRRLAFVGMADGGPALVTLDLLTGERSVVTDERTAGFFWSPDGGRLAALVLAGAGQLQWIAFDGHQMVRLAPFRPGPAWLREVLPFFEQYAQSHSVWSADGDQLVAAGLDADGSTEAVVQSVANETTERLPGARLAWWANP